MIEEWKEIPGYEGYYEASNLGRIRSIKRSAERKFNGNVFSVMNYNSKILKPMSTKHDYLKYGLSKNGKTISYTGHRLVALTWISNPNNYPQVHHKDHNKHNNSVDNLEWVTASKNTKEAIKAGKHHGGFKVGTNHHSGKFTKEQKEWMIRLKKEYNLSLTEVTEIFNSSKGYMSQIITGIRPINTKKKDISLIYCKKIPVLTVCPE